MKKAGLVAVAAIIVILPLSSFLTNGTADDLLIRFDADGQNTAVKFFDYLDSGLTFWVVDATGAQPVVYTGLWKTYGKWFVESTFGLPIDRSNGKLNVKDFVFNVDVYYSRGRLSAVLVNELGGFYKTLWHFGEQEARVNLHGKWVIGARSNSFFLQGQDSFAVGPFIGKKYGPFDITVWGWRDALEWSSYGITIQAKGSIKY